MQVRLRLTLLTNLALDYVDASAVKPSNDTILRVPSFFINLVNSAGDDITTLSNPIYIKLKLDSIHLQDTLYYYDTTDSTWKDAASTCGSPFVNRDLTNSELTVKACHLTQFALYGNDEASGSDDPHFIGFQGQSFYVYGQHDKIYNIISTPTLQMNARFVEYPSKHLKPGSTWFGEWGIKVSDP
jgi:hypothetical protein